MSRIAWRSHALQSNGFFFMTKAKIIRERTCSICQRLSTAGQCKFCRDLKSTLGHEHQEVYQYMPLVWKLAIKAYGRKTGKALGGVEDLVGEGVLALIEAIRRFDPNKGVKPLTFYLSWIWGRLRSATDRNNGLIRTPAHRVGDGAMLIVKKFSEFQDDEDDREFDAPAPVPAEKHFDRDDILLVLEAVSKQRPRDKFILECRFGLGHYPEMSLERVAESLDVSKERVRQLEVKAIERTRADFMKLRAERRKCRAS